VLLLPSLQEHDTSARAAAAAGGGDVGAAANCGVNIKQEKTTDGGQPA
jgi:hypothetical protein